MYIASVQGARIIATLFILMIAMPLAVGSLCGLYELRDQFESCEWSAEEEGESEKESERESERESEKEIDFIMNRHQRLATLRASGSAYLLKNRGLGSVDIDVLTPPPDFI